MHQHELFFFVCFWPLAGIFFFLFPPVPFIIFALLFSLPPSRNSDPGSHMTGSSPPLSATVRALHFYRERRFQLFVPFLTHVIHRRSQQLVLFFLANKFKISPRRDSNSRTNSIVLIVSIVCSIRGLPLL